MNETSSFSVSVGDLNFFCHSSDTCDNLEAIDDTFTTLQADYKKELLKKEKLYIKP